MKKFMCMATALALIFTGCKNRSGNGGAAAQPEQDAAEPAIADTLAAQKVVEALPEEPVFDIVTSMGTIKVRLYKDTPRHRDNFAKLAVGGFYDRVKFHRVIKDFMIQGGDPNSRNDADLDSWGQGGPGYNLPAEMRDESGAPLHRHKRGALAAARRGDMANPFKESSGSQFYLVQNPDACIHLDGEYTVFGETVAGFNVIDRIAESETDRYDRPTPPVFILSIRPDKEMNKNPEKTSE